MKQITITYEEYYKILKVEKTKLDDSIKQIDSNLNYLLLCCDYINGVAFNNPNKIIDLLNNNEEDFSRVLKILFRKDCLDGMEGQLDCLLGEAYGKHNGYTFSRPNNWQEFILFIKECTKIMMYSIGKVNPYCTVFNNMQMFIVRTANALLQQKHKKETVSNGYDKYIKAIDKSEKVLIEKEELDLIKSILNVYNDEFINMISEDNDSQVKKTSKIGMGDTFEFIVKAYNKKYDTYFVDSQTNKINKKIEQYYKRIKSIPFEQLTQQNLPKYSNVSFLPMMKELIKRFEPEVKIYNQDEEIKETTDAEKQAEELYTFLQMHYLGYFLQKNHEVGSFKKIKK